VQREGEQGRFPPLGRFAWIKKRGKGKGWTKCTICHLAIVFKEKFENAHNEIGGDSAQRFKLTKSSNTQSLEILNQWS
jgi:hypothetical protein